MVRGFRFGAVAGPSGQDVGGWRDTVRRVADLGFTSLLMPDGMQLLSPFTALAVAAETADVRVGTFVAAAPLRPPRLAAWDAHSLALLTGGRFDFGIGTGRPAVREWAEQLGLPWGTADDRLRLVSDTLDHLRDLDGERRTPVMMAAAGPKALALAAAKADVVTLAHRPLATRQEVSAMAERVRGEAGPRGDGLELAMNLFAVGEVPPWVEQFTGVDAATLARDSLAVLRGTPEDMAAELLRRREEFGVSFVSVNARVMEAFAPVIPLLAGEPSV